MTGWAAPRDAPAGLLALALAANLLAFSAQAWAGSARVSGAEMNGFGRAVFTFDEMPRTTAKITNGVPGRHVRPGGERQSRQAAHGIVVVCQRGPDGP